MSIDRAAASEADGGYSVGVRTSVVHDGKGDGELIRHSDWTSAIGRGAVVAPGVPADPARTVGAGATARRGAFVVPLDGGADAFGAYGRSGAGAPVRDSDASGCVGTVPPCPGNLAGDAKASDAPVLVNGASVPTATGENVGMDSRSGPDDCAGVAGNAGASDAPGPVDGASALTATGENVGMYSSSGLDVGAGCSYKVIVFIDDSRFPNRTPHSPPHPPSLPMFGPECPAGVTLTEVREPFGPPKDGILPLLSFHLCEHRWLEET